MRSAVFSSRSERLGRDLDGRLVSRDPLLEMEEVGGVFHLTFKNIHVNCVFNIYIYTYIYSRNPYDPCFEWKGPSFGGFKPKNRGQTGSRYIYIYT